MFFAALFIISVCLADSTSIQYHTVLHDTIMVKQIGTQKDLIRDNIGSICTATVSIIALCISAFLAFNSQRKQFKVQIKTTIDREWVESVRKHISVCLVQADIIAIYWRTFGGVVEVPTEHRFRYLDSINLFKASYHALHLYLNLHNTPEFELANLISTLYKQCDNGSIERDIIPNIWEKAKEVIEIRLENN